MITEKQLNEALKLICEYEAQLIRITEGQNLSKSESGCRVKLSKWGLEMQGKAKKSFTGTVITFRSNGYPNQGTVTVKWDQRKNPDCMDISQIEKLTPTTNNPIN